MDERKTLKPKRLIKRESSKRVSVSQYRETTVKGYQGTVSTNTQENGNVLHNRLCADRNVIRRNTKNLAHNRLKTLRENLKAELQIQPLKGAFCGQTRVNIAQKTNNQHTLSTNVIASSTSTCDLEVNISISSQSPHTNNSFESHKNTFKSPSVACEEHNSPLLVSNVNKSEVKGLKRTARSLSDTSEETPNKKTSVITLHQKKSRKINNAHSNNLTQMKKPIKNIVDADYNNENVVTKTLKQLDKSTASVDVSCTGKTGDGVAIEEMEWTNEESDEKKDEEAIDVSKNKNVIAVVVDTNIFLSNLSKLKDVINLKTPEFFEVIIYVPWMVITELDYMKDTASQRNIKQKAVDAINFINSHLMKEDGKIVGQSVLEMDKQKQIGNSPDDKIISSCLQALEKYETVFLFSNDVNMKNKALINDIPVCSINDVISKVTSKLWKNSKTQKISHKLAILFSSVICECARNAFGDAWMKMELLQHPPWSLFECLKRFQRYWRTVFCEKLLKQCAKAIEDLLKFLECNKCICDDSVEYENMMKLSINLCIFLKDIDECRANVENMLSDIIRIA